MERTDSVGKYADFYRPQTQFAKIMFLHLSVSHSVHRGEYLGRCHPGQVHPMAGTPPWAGTPPRQVYSPLGRYRPGQVPPQAGMPPGQVHPQGRYTPLGRYTPQAGTPPWVGTPPWAGTHPPGQVHPPGHVHLPSRELCLLGDTGNMWAVRILLECILFYILFSSGNLPI